MLFHKCTSPACGRCERAVTLDGGNMLCRLYGIVHETYACRRYVYDPLKRRPSRTPPLPKGKLAPLD